MNFEKYLKTKHAEQYRETDDDVAEDYIKWADDLEWAEILVYVEDFVRQREKEAYKLGAIDMWEAVKLNREGGFKDEMVSIALARIDAQAQQFINSLGK